MDREPLQFLNNGLPSMVYGQKIKTSRPQIMGREGVLAVPPKFIASAMHFVPTFIGFQHNVGKTVQTTNDFT